MPEPISLEAEKQKRKRGRPPKSSYAQAQTQDDNPFTVDSYKDLPSEWDHILAAARAIEPSDFFLKSEDSKGHSDSLRVRIPKNWSGPLRHIAERIPTYKGVITYLIRDAVIHRVAHWIRAGAADTISGLDPAIVGPFLLEAENDKAIADANKHLSILKGIKEAVSAMVKARDLEGLFEVLDRQLRIARTCRDPFRSRLIKRIEGYQRKYGEAYRGYRERKRWEAGDQETCEIDLAEEGDHGYE